MLHRVCLVNGPSVSEVISVACKLGCFLFLLGNTKCIILLIYSRFNVRLLSDPQVYFVFSNTWFLSLISQIKHSLLLQFLMDGPCQHGLLLRCTFARAVALTDYLA